MLAARFALAALAIVAPIWADGSSSSTAPFYTAASIVNSATNTPGALAPNSIASIYGTNLSFDTAAVSSSDISAGALPTHLAGVTVIVGNLLANLYYVSPKQINFLVPNLLRPANVTVYVNRESLVGPPVTVTLLEVAPGLFQSNPTTVIATHADGSVVTGAAPAQPSEIIVLYAAGLGRTTPDELTGQLAKTAAPIQHLKDLSVLLAGNPLDPGSILYAGATPGFAGLYQVNVRLPDTLPPNPDIQLSLVNQVTPPALKIPVQQ